MAARQPATIAPLDVTHVLAKAKPRTCGDAHTLLVTAFGPKADLAPFASAGCRRLPRHEVTVEKGHKADKPRGLMTPAERRRMADRVTKPKADKVASKVVTVGGTKFRVFADGKVTPVEAPAASLVTPAKPKARSRKVRVVAEVPADRKVAAPAKVTHTRRHVTSGKPSARLA